MLDDMYWCTRGGVEHKFEPRYSKDSSHITRDHIQWCLHADRKQLIDNLKSEEYICDICVRCGKVINQQKSDAVNGEGRDD